MLSFPPRNLPFPALNETSISAYSYKPTSSHNQIQSLIVCLKNLVLSMPLTTNHLLLIQNLFLFEKRSLHKPDLKNQICSNVRTFSYFPQSTYLLLILPKQTMPLHMSYHGFFCSQMSIPKSFYSIFQ